MLHKKLTITSGRLFLVTDIHGHYDVLKAALDSVKFKLGIDTLVCAGDLIDRGPDSMETIEFFTNREDDRIYSVLGNHDQFAVNGLNMQAQRVWFGNGGGWALLGGSKERLAYLKELASSLPLAITIEFQGRKYGVVHAHPAFDDWDELVATLEEGSPTKSVVDCLLWERGVVEDKLNYQIDTDPVKNVGVVFHGHTVVKDPLLVGNRLHFDTGIAYGKYLSLVEVTSDGIVFTKHREQNA